MRGSRPRDSVGPLTSSSPSSPIKPRRPQRRRIRIGIAVKFIIHIKNGVPVHSPFKSYVDIESEGSCVIRAHQSAVFSNWISFRCQLEQVGLGQHQNITLDLSDTKLVNNSVVEKLHEMQADFEQLDLKLTIVGLESHKPASAHKLSARRAVSKKAAGYPTALGGMELD